MDKHKMDKHKMDYNITPTPSNATRRTGRTLAPDLRSPQPATAYEPAEDEPQEGEPLRQIPAALDGMHAQMVDLCSQVVSLEQALAPILRDEGDGVPGEAQAEKSMRYVDLAVSIRSMTDQARHANEVLRSIIMRLEL